MEIEAYGTIPQGLEMHTSHVYYDQEEKPRVLVIGGRFLQDGEPRFSDEIY